MVQPNLLLLTVITLLEVVFGKNLEQKATNYHHKFKNVLL